MRNRIFCFFIIVLISATCFGGACCGKSAGGAKKVAVKKGPLEIVLDKLNKESASIESYQCELEYTTAQPEPFGTQTVRRGELFYEKADGKSRLRINFKTLKQDDEDVEKIRDEWIFDGKFLTHIDYQIKEVKVYQQNDPNDPNDPNATMDAFELAKRNFPIIGFSKTEELKKDFDITLVDPNENEIKDTIKLHLKVKADSVYKDDYTTIEFWIDSKANLPVGIVANSTGEDVYHVRLLKAKVNKKIKKNTFEIKIPRGFSRSMTTAFSGKEK